MLVASMTILPVSPSTFPSASAMAVPGTATSRTSALLASPPSRPSVVTLWPGCPECGEAVADVPSADGDDVHGLALSWHESPDAPARCPCEGCEGGSVGDGRC